MEFMKLFTFLFWAQSLSVGSVESHVLGRTVFHRSLLFLNRTLTNLALWTRSDIASDVACASECARDAHCESFFYNEATDDCMGHAVNFYGTEESQEAVGSNYYTSNVDKQDCAEILINDEDSEDGVYIINPLDGKGPIRVYCDMTTDGGGWTVFQRRTDGSVDFFLNWSEYKNGFGNPDGEFWLGNDNIHRLSKARSSVLRIDMVDQTDVAGYAEYTDFSIDGETDKYRLHINAFTGDRGDSLTRHNNDLFSTKDQDNDVKSTHCAQDSKAAWWYDSCHLSNLNGDYGSSVYSQCVSWYSWHGHEVSLKQTEMKMRPS